jgi:hypothetical protein
MLGIVGEQTPKGGALTLNAIAGIGMLSVGILGSPFIGFLQESSVASVVKEELPAVYEEVHTESAFLLGSYAALDEAAIVSLPEETQDQVSAIRDRETQGALAKMTMFPAFMLLCYIGLIFYFKSRGGYKPMVIN